MRRTDSDRDRELVRRLKEENQELRQEVERLSVYRALAYRDELTQLFNRRYFDDRLRQELRRATRHGQPLSLLLVDLDDFKRINDTAGHLVGDAVLRWVGGFLKRIARGFDVPCRMGGDEFALILPDTDLSGAASVVARIEQALASAVDLPPLPANLRVAFSIGVATFPDEGCAPWELVALADQRMYENKRKRRARRSSSTSSRAA